MKAWLVRQKDAFCAEVVFAETRGKARALATHTDIVNYADFIDIEVHRMPKADKYYKEGKWRLDWVNPQDRIALVKDCGFMCDFEYFDLNDCKVCSAKEYCDMYKDRQAEEEGDN